MHDHFEQLSVPSQGEIVDFRGGSSVPDTPIVPICFGAAPKTMSVAQQVLDRAAEVTGRRIYWLRVSIGERPSEGYDSVPIPTDTIRVFRRYNVGLIGPLARTDQKARELTRELRHRVGLTVGVDSLRRIKGIPRPRRKEQDIDLTVFREISDDPESAFDFEVASEASGTTIDSGNDFGTFLEEFPEFSATPISKSGTESLVETAIEYTLDRDLNTLTIVHAGDLLSASEEGFEHWASTFLMDEYSDAIIDEKTFRDAYNEHFPEDEVVVKKRRTAQMGRDLLSHPNEYDVLVAPVVSGGYVVAVASEGIGGMRVTPQVMIGDDRIVARSQPEFKRSDGNTAENPLGPILAGCLLFDYFGWDDAFQMVLDGISTTLANGLVPRDLYSRRASARPVSAAQFGESVVEHLPMSTRASDSGGVNTTIEERAAIKRTIAGVYNIVFTDAISQDEIELNQLLNQDEEADVALPEVGINFYYWRQWPIERRLEVLLHELAHVDENPGERDHGPEFYDRFVELVEIASDWSPELEALFHGRIDFKQLKRSVVESVHEGTIETDMETVRERKQILRKRFGLAEGDYY